MTDTLLPHWGRFRCIGRRFRHDLVALALEHRNWCTGCKLCRACRRRFGAEVTADRDEASRIRGRQREHALRFGARIEPARNPLPLHRAIAKEMQRSEEHTSELQSTTAHLV